MLDTTRVDAVPANDSPLQLTVTSNCTLLEIKSWLPEHTTGRKPVSIGGRELPSEAGVTLRAPLHILCLAPGEWLIVSHEPWTSSFRRHVAAELLEQGLAPLDITDGFAVLKVRGRVARDVLSKGCGLDLHVQAFPAGRCARTRFAQMPVIIDCVDDSPRFDLYVARSYVQCFGDWFEDAAVEFMSSSTWPHPRPASS